MKTAVQRSLWLICLFLFALTSEAKKTRPRERDDDANNGPLARPLKVKINDRNPQRQDLFDGLEDPEGSAQGISQASINPYLLQNGQAGLQNQLFQGAGGLGGFGAFNGIQSPYVNNLFQNPYLTGGGAGNNNFQSLGGGSGFQNPYLFQQQLQGGIQGLQGLQGGIQGLQGLQGLQGGIQGIQGLQGGIQGGITPYSDIFSGQSNLYNNPYLQGNNGAGGINPLLLASVRNPQYLNGGVNPFLSQGLLSPYTNFNQINPYSSYPLASRFGIGVGRTNSRGQSSSSNNSSDE